MANDHYLEVSEAHIIITKDEYDALIERSHFLSYLEAAGVDNWEGYEMAIDTMEEVRYV